MSRLKPGGNAVVVGAGVMGAQIAAHLANAGWHATLLDILADPSAMDKKTRNAAASRGLERAQKSKPAAFFVPDLASGIKLGNIVDDLACVKGADWVIEAVVEKPYIKHKIHEGIEAHLREDALITTNTSGLSISEMCNGRSSSFQSRFFGTHFFNPPRYMKLLEVIPTPNTSPEAIAKFNSFGEAILGKRIVMAKDTPGFIANRLGVYAMQQTIHATLAHRLTVEEVDFLTGPLVGHPKSGTFRLSDICGLDISADVAGNLTERLPDNPRRSAFAIPPVMQRLLAEGRIGEKAGAGFYRREKDKTILALDWDTLDYRQRKTVAFPSIEGLKSLPLQERVRRLIALNEPAGKFLWETTRDMICYAAEIATEIADDIISIDNAIKWGFGWEQGPFEIWDALGVHEVVQRLEAEGSPVPLLVNDLLSSNQSSFYSTKEGQRYYVTIPKPNAQRPMPTRPELIVLKDLKEQHKVIKDSPDATLIDIGDSVSCLEFHTKMNVLGPGVCAMIDWSREYVENNGVALVIGNQGEHFSAGFNLQLLLMGIYDDNLDEMLATGFQLQEVVIRLKRAKAPVVSAVHGYTLGGGCEILLHSAGVQASAESYIGLPEVGVGIIPAACGTTEMLIRAMDQVPAEGGVDPYPFVHQVFTTIGMAKISSSAEEARRNSFLRNSDGISMNADRLIYDAKQCALAIAATGYRPAEPATVMAMGEDGIARFDLELHIMHRSGYISDHDKVVGHELATVLCGGPLVHPQTVTEDYLLGLERESFVRLCGYPKTVERIKYMLETGKPLRN